MITEVAQAVVLRSRGEFIYGSIVVCATLIVGSWWQIVLFRRAKRGQTKPLPRWAQSMIEVRAARNTGTPRRLFTVGNSFVGVAAILAFIGVLLKSNGDSYVPVTVVAAGLMLIGMFFQVFANFKARRSLK